MPWWKKSTVRSRSAVLKNRRFGGPVVPEDRSVTTLATADWETARKSKGSAARSAMDVKGSAANPWRSSGGKPGRPANRRR